MNDIGFYCLSYEHKRKEQIEKVFKTLNINAQIYKGVDFNDVRLQNKKLDPHQKRVWSICYGHLDMIRSFYESGHSYGIFCEDDIIIRKDFIKHLPSIIADFNSMSLDILLLGYLCENPIDTYSNFPVKKSDTPPFKYLGYPDELWGAQMYLISRAHAHNILAKYYEDYADKTLEDTSIIPFSADWTITKEGHRALIYPLVAIENMNDEQRDYARDRCLTGCYNFSYTKELFG